MDVLKNKQYKEYDRLSRYSSFPIFYNTLDRKYVNETPTKLNQNTEYSLYKVLAGESYDLIALRAYNNPTYYWIICDFNDIQNPFINPIPGTYLKIPVLSTIEFSNY